jgi:hypothetical protein
MTDTNPNDTYNLLLQVGDQVQYSGIKLDQLAQQVHKLAEEQQNLSQVIGSLISVTTAVEIATAAAIVMGSLSLYFVLKWIGKQPHNQQLPTPAVIPKPSPLRRMSEEEEDELLREYSGRPKDTAQIDTLAQLARELNGR